MANPNVQAIIDVADNENLIVRHDYSGRGMFGKSCIAVELDSPIDVGKFFFELGQYNQEQGTLTAEINDYRTDAMGHNIILYWPNIQVSTSETTYEKGADGSFMPVKEGCQPGQYIKVGDEYVPRESDET